mgnify:CR=1 FL=1
MLDRRIALDVGLTIKELNKFFEKAEKRRFSKKDNLLLNKIAAYIFLYAVAIAKISYVFDNKTILLNKSFLDRITKLKRMVRDTEDPNKKFELIEEMIDVCLDNGIDPF